MKPKLNVSLALFDIKPKRQSGSFDAQVTTSVPRHLNLRTKAPVTPTISMEGLLASAPVASHKDFIEREVERELGSFAKPAASVVVAPSTYPSPEAVLVRSEPSQGPLEHTLATPDHSELERFWNTQDVPSSGVSQARGSTVTFASVPSMPIQVPVAQLSPAAREVEIWTQRIKSNQQARGNMPIRVAKKGLGRGWRHRTKMFIGLAIAIAVGGTGVVALARGGVFVRQSIVENGQDAVANLEQAKQDLEAFDFSRAADNFALATSNFGKASGALSNIGASLASVLSSFPGFRNVQAASNIVEAGKRISQSGESLSRAFAGLQQVNFLAMMHPQDGSTVPSIAKPLNNFKEALLYADKNIRTAQQLLADVQDDALPEDKRELFESFRDKIPLFQSSIGEAMHYSDFLLKLVGDYNSKQYLVLLENNTELRPTGGFPGTYALITFDRGALKKVFIDDIYNIDGQIKENIIPPRPIQHITPNWGLRDANWFADFPTSARVIQTMYQRDGGGAVDGVLAINPSVIARLLDITGPIAMPEYNVTLDSRNFLAEIQDEVEYKASRAQPKKILFDFQPRFFAKLSTLPKEKWMDVFKVLLESIDQKHILASFNDPSLEQTAIENGFAGELKSTDGDYLQVVYSNVKGGKADAVTTNSMKLSTELNDATGISHTLAITRVNTGGNSPYPFYNHENSAYVKVYLPKGAVFDSIAGQSSPGFKPLVSYADLGFKKDPDLDAVESTITNPQPDVDVFTESDKTVIGFWIITKPQKTSSVALSYHIPYSAIRLPKKQYSLVWQKQAGTFSDAIQFNFKLHPGMSVAGHSPELQELGNSLVVSSDLSVDKELQVVLN